MTADAWLTLATVAVTMAILVGTRIAPDLVLVGALTALMLTGVLSPTEALSGLGNPGLATVGVLYVVVAALTDTGAVQAIGTRLLGRPRSVAAAQLRLMMPITALSAFLNNTPLVAMFVPVVEDWCKRMGFAASKLMIPLSYAAILGGLCTLVGTSTNVVVHGLVQESGALDSIGFFEVGAVGLPAAIVGILYVLLTQRWLLPERRPPLRDPGRTREYALEMLVEESSPLIGKSVEEAGLRHLPGAFLAEIDRDGTLIPAVAPSERLRAGDRLLFVGAVDSLVDLLRLRGLYPAPPDAPADVPGLEYAGVVEAAGPGAGWEAGDRVMGIVGGGAMATHVTVSGREAMPIPEGMPAADAAAIPEVFLTAYDALFVQGELRLGETVLVHAVGSGVGTAALQLVRAAGAICIGTSRTEQKLER
ncbi:MAG: hypothetical protein LOD94_13290, partial [Gammaproteobacteria bacterium]